MYSTILTIFLLTQTSLQSAGGTAKILGEKMTPSIIGKSITGGLFMGISRDSSKIYLSETGYEIDKRKFNFNDLPPVGNLAYIKYRKQGKKIIAEKVAPDIRTLLIRIRQEKERYKW